MSLLSVENNHHYGPGDYKPKEPIMPLTDILFDSCRAHLFDAYRYDAKCELSLVDYGYAILFIFEQTFAHPNSILVMIVF